MGWNNSSSRAKVYKQCFKLFYDDETMKKILIILTIILFNNCSTQIKVNKGKDIEIIETQPPLPDGKFLIKNNTSNTYIIDPLGFWGKQYF